MKYIKKDSNCEPNCLAQFKSLENSEWQPTYDNLKNPEKKELHKYLLTEQGYICCYCGDRIQLDNSHIEHFCPQESHPELQLDYRNLLASCLRQPDAGDPLHCGVSKGNWHDRHLLVSPTIADCGEFFEYRDNGTIVPTKDANKQAAAAETIERLKLDIPKLNTARKRSIEGLLEGDLTIDEVDLLIDGFSSVDLEGKYTPFCQMLLYLLDRERQYILKS
jgi:uncharacterized protein (TIGR02646 family)